MLSHRLIRLTVQFPTKHRVSSRFFSEIANDHQQQSPQLTEPKPNGIRLCQFIAGTGLASRRESERIIQDKRVTIAGKMCNLPSLIIDPTQLPVIEIDGVPLRNNYPPMPRIWAVWKQSGEIMSTVDPQKSRPMLLDRMKNMIMPQICTQYADELRPLYRLDYVVEGLTFFTNSGELAKMIHEQNLPISYRIRINGLLTDSKLRGLLAGLHVKNETFLPMKIEIENQSNTITWLKVTTKEKQFQNVAKAFKHLFLNITRCICVGFGTYQWKDLFPTEQGNSTSITTSKTSTVQQGYAEVKLSPPLHAAYMKLQHIRQHRRTTTTSTNPTTQGKMNSIQSGKKVMKKKREAFGVPKLTM